MEQVTLSAYKREQGGKGVARKLRAAGRIPGVAYGHGLDPVPLTVDERELLSAARHGANVLIDLRIDGAELAADTLAIVKELQRDPTTDRVLNADFQWVSLTERIRVSVPIAVEGTPHGVAMGGIMEQSLWELEVEVVPTAIPASIVVPVADMEIGHVVHVRDLSVPEDVEVLSPPDEPVVSIVAPVVEEEAPKVEAEAEAAAAEEATEREAKEES